MKANEKKILRESVMQTISELPMEDFEFRGFTKEGAAFSNGVDVIVIKATIKNDGFDLDAALSGVPQSSTSLTKVDKVLDVLMEEI